MAHLVGLRFDASLGKAWPPKDSGFILLELDLTATAGPIKCSHTGGDVWCCPDGAVVAPPAAAGPASAVLPPLPAAPLKCNAWDSKGRNPAMNVYVHLHPPGGFSNSSDDAPPRCKLGVLIQHALPKLAVQAGGYGQVALDWVTWVAEPATGTPIPATVAPFGMPNPAHWMLLQDLAKERESGAGTASGRPPQPDSAEDLALRRAKETLLAVAGYFGPEAVAKVSRLTVRKLYQREYHFFDTDGKDVADSRRHALEWAVGLEEVEELLSHNPEARAKLNERLTAPSGGAAGGTAGATGPARKRIRISAGTGTGTSTGRRVVLSVAGTSFARAGSTARQHSEATRAPAASVVQQQLAAAATAATAATAAAAAAAPARTITLSGSAAQQQQHLMGLLLQLQHQPPASQEQQAQAQAQQQAQLAGLHVQANSLQLQAPHLPPPQPPQLQLEFHLRPAQRPAQQPAQQLRLQPQPQQVPQQEQPAQLHLHLQPSPQHPQAVLVQQQQSGALQQPHLVALPRQHSAALQPLHSVADSPLQVQVLGQGQGLLPVALAQLPGQQHLQPGGQAANGVPTAVLTPSTAGISELLHHLPAAPSWLADDALCPPLPEGSDDGSGSRSSEVEQPSPARADPPALREPELQSQAAPPEQQVVPPQQQLPAAQPQLVPLQQQQQQLVQVPPPPQQQQQRGGRLHLLPAKRPRVPPAQPPAPAPAGAAAPNKLPLLSSTVLPSQARAASSAAEVDPLDAALEAWEAHDRVNRQLGEAQQQLERQQQELAALQQQRDSLQRQLTQALGQLAAAPAPGSPQAGAQLSSAAAAMAAAAAVQAQLADLQSLLPRSVRFQLSQQLQQPDQAELLPHAAAVHELGGRAVEAALAAYAASLAPPAPPASNPNTNQV